MNKSKKIFLIIPLVLMLIIIANNTVLGFENFSTDIMQDLGDGSKIESANKAVNRVWGTIVLILQMLAVTAIILAGVRYMFASADAKADIKKQTIGLVVGAVLVFGASIIVDFVVNVTKEITDGNVTSSSTHSSSASSTNSSAQNDLTNDKNNNTSGNTSKKPSTTSYKITPSISALTLKVGQTKSVVPVIEPSIDKKTAVKYISDNTKVAKVDSKGNVTAIEKGLAKIYVKVGNLDNYLISTIIVTPKEIFVEEIAVEEKEIKMDVGEKYTIETTIKPLNATNKNVIYSSDNTKVATVDSKGNVIAKGVGKTNIYAKIAKTDKTCSMSVTVMPKEILVENITLNEKEIAIKEGESYTINPVISPSDATNKNIIYSSDNTKVATVDSKGKILAKGVGKTNIHAKVSNKSTSVIVIVSQKEVLVEEVSISKNNVEIKVGDSYTINPIINPSDATNRELIYSSSDNNIATVDNKGNITPKTAGEATITIKNQKSNKFTQMVVKVIESHKIHFINTYPSSDCILLESNGHYALIDAGRYSNYSIIKEYFKNMNITKLDFLLLTHNHKDHVGAAAKVINKYKPDKLYLKKYYGNDTNGSAGPYDLEMVAESRNRYELYLDAANNEKTEIVFIDGYDEGYTIKLGEMVIQNYNLKNHLVDGATYAQKMSENGNSITSLVTVNGLKTYLASDLTYDRYADPIAEKIGKVDVHKLGHHGLNNGTSQKESECLKPDYAIATISSEEIANFEVNAISRALGYTKEKKVYFSGDNVVVVDYTSGVVRITEIK